MKYPENGVILMDKGYQGAQQQLQAIVIPKMKPYSEILPIQFPVIA